MKEIKNKDNKMQDWFRQVSTSLHKVLVDKVAPRLIENKNKMAAKLNDIIAFR